MTKPLLVMGMLCWATVVLAQTHPCDQVYPTNPAVASPVKFGFCVLQTESQAATAYKVYLDGSPNPVINTLLPIVGSPNSGGMVLIETPPVIVSQGNHTVQVSTVDIAGEGAKTSPTPFGVIGLPVAPVNVHLVP